MKNFSKKICTKYFNLIIYLPAGEHQQPLKSGRLAQGESTALTRQGSQVQILYRPPLNFKESHAGFFFISSKVFSWFFAGRTGQAESPSPTMQHRIKIHSNKTDYGTKQTICAPALLGFSTTHNLQMTTDRNSIC